MAAPEPTFLRVYDNAIFKWIRRWAIDVSGNSVPIVMSSPMRAFSSIQELRSKDPNIQKFKFELDKPPMPFISYERGAVTVRNIGHNQPIHFPIGWLGNDKTQQVTGRRPLPRNIAYSLEIWSRYRTTNAHLVDAVESEWSGERTYIVQEMRKPWGNKLVAIINEGMEDSSELEGEVDGVRIIRTTLRFHVEGWHFQPVDYAPTVVAH